MDMILQQVLKEYGFIPADIIVERTGTGLINSTFIIRDGEKEFILQRINDHVFKNPYYIDDNINAIGKYLHRHFPHYFFTHPVKTTKGKTLIEIDNQYYRLFDFIKGSHTFTVVNQPGLAFEAAKQFGRFTKLLTGFPASSLHITIPGFHDLTLRQHQFEQAQKNAREDTLKKAATLIKSAKLFSSIAIRFEKLHQSHGLHTRVIHHDTKISNVLFDGAGKGICVIDLDTVMPGYFISDVGDMMRTYLSPVSEEERDLGKIEVRDDYFKAIADGYLSEMQDQLNDTEIQYFVYAGQMMIYMQGIRFLTDFLNGNIYYDVTDPLHNFYRAANQFELLKLLNEKTSAYEKIIQLLLTKKHYTA